jgi:hypothetical protein
MLETSNQVYAKHDRPWVILTGLTSVLFVIWLGVGGYRWEGYPCFAWEVSLSVRTVYFSFLLLAGIGFCQFLMRAAKQPQEFNQKVICLAFLNFILLRLILGSALPLLDDEAYHWIWPSRLDWCYYDHGGLLGWLCYPFWAVSKSVFWARLGPILMGTLTAALTWHLGFWITRDRQIANRALAGMLLLPVGLIGTTILFTDTPLACIWLGTLWVLLLAIQRRRLGWWVLLGVILGLGLNTKFFVLGLIFLLIVYMLFDPQGRKAWTGPGPYLAAGIALILAFPLIYWNANHEWVTFYFNFVKRRSSLGFHPWGMVVYAFNQTMLVGPLLFIWCLIYPLFWGIRRVRERNLPALALFLAGFVPFFLYSVLKLFRPVNTSSVNWTAPLYALLLILLAWGARDSKWGRRGLLISLRLGAITTCVILGGLIGGDFLGPETVKSLAGPFVTEKRMKRYLKDFYGWYPVSREVDILYQRYNGQAPTFVMARTYMHAAILSQYTQKPPLALSMGYDAMYGRCFDYWNEPEKHIGWDCLFVANHPISNDIEKMLKTAFESVRELNPDERVCQGDIAGFYHIYYCHKAKYFPGTKGFTGPELQN